MTLQALLEALPEKEIVGKTKGVKIKGIVYDPLRVKPGYLYVAIPMYTQLDKIEIPDGHRGVAEAVRKGAVAAVIQKDVEVPAPAVKIKVPDSRYALALLAHKFYGYPSRKLKLIGVTGTNGKTTTTHIIESILIQTYKVGLIGTLYYKLQGVIHPSKDTTPEPPDLQEIFRQMTNRHFDYCVMEVSSHGIDFHRVEGCRFEAAVFTNLTQDHLDYHRTMENYLMTKVRLFKGLEPDKFAIVNVDDSYARYFIENTPAQVITYGVRTSADVAATDIELSIKGTNFRLKTPRGIVDIHSRLIGLFNVYNSLAGAAACLSQGIDLEVIKRGLEAKIHVAGRFELVERGQDFSVVVDYAHTPDGLRNVLSLARDLRPRRVITVFGCGGDRDKGKRPLMGKVASELSDMVIVTSDNPRNEDPEKIARDILRGIRGKNYRVILDRYEAIEYAIRMARSGDIVMLCGKGHETTQTLKDRIIEFSDAKVAAEILERCAKT